MNKYDHCPSRAAARGRKKFRWIQALLLLALLLVLAACGSTTGNDDKNDSRDDDPDQVGEALTKTEFLDFSEQFVEDAVAAGAGLFENDSFLAVANLLNWLELPYSSLQTASESVQYLPRGKWEQQYFEDEWGGYWDDWKKVGEPGSSGLLQYDLNTTVSNYDYETD
jgi:hypothetical protein